MNRPNMRYIWILAIIGIFFSNIASANTAIEENGVLNINLDKNTPLLYNAKDIQITIVRVEDNGIEKIIQKFENKLPFNISINLGKGTYKVYIKKDDSTIIEYNNDDTGYKISDIEKTINIPGSVIQDASIKYRNGLLTDVLSDLPWRINPGQKIPISYIIKDANQYPLYIRTITIYDDKAPIGNDANDTLVFTRGLYQWFTKNLWYDYDSLSPSLFGETDNNINIHIKFDMALAFDVHNFYTLYKSQYKLPTFKNWYYGDTHYHSNYTDNVYEFGSPVKLTQVTGSVIGLNWVAITDHSFDLDPNRFKSLSKESNIYSTNGFKMIPSEEISCTVPSSIYQEYNHYLAYNITNFIPGGEWEDGTGSNYNCSQLVTIVNRQKGFGYPAHPMDDGIFTQPWQDYNLSFKGLEIWNGEGNIPKLEQGIRKWVELLLKGRKIYVEAGSDGHGDFNSAYGKVRTVTFISPNLNFNNTNILSALRKGNSIMTNGPLVIFDINGTIIGNTRNVAKDSNIKLNVRWNSTPEFGTVDHITILKGIVGINETIIQEIHPHTYSGSYSKNLIASRNSYYRIEAHNQNGKRVYTNPIWINIP